jgi:hypothetical protein
MCHEDLCSVQSEEPYYSHCGADDVESGADGQQQTETKTIYTKPSPNSIHRMSDNAKPIPTPSICTTDAIQHQHKRNVRTYETCDANRLATRGFETRYAEGDYEKTTNRASGAEYTACDYLPESSIKCYRLRNVCLNYLFAISMW